MGSVAPTRRQRALVGRYLFGGCSNEVWSLRVVNRRAVDVRKEPVEVPEIVSFGVVALLTGSVCQLVAAKDT
jgi:hypothetical protein